MNDTISDLLVRISNARAAGKSSFAIEFSRVKKGVLEVLKDEGYVGDFKIDSAKEVISVDLSGSLQAFEKIRRLSRPGRRLYTKSKDIPRPKGYGLVIVSTPKGILSGRKAKAAGVGGELICEVF